MDAQEYCAIEVNALAAKTLQRNHIRLQCYVAALDDNVATLGQETSRLEGIHSDHADHTKTKLSKI